MERFVEIYFTKKDKKKKIMNFKRRITGIMMILFSMLFLVPLSGYTVTQSPDITVTAAEKEPYSGTVTEDGVYSSRDEVALYIHTYGHLPSNFITKREARKLGWQGGGLDDVAYGKCIGGDGFSNREGLLPSKRKRKYYECDIDTLHENERGEKRIIYSNDGLIYYTEDHYASYELLYGNSS